MSEVELKPSDPSEYRLVAHDGTKPPEKLKVTFKPRAEAKLLTFELEVKDVPALIECLEKCIGKYAGNDVNYRSKLCQVVSKLDDLLPILNKWMEYRFRIDEEAKKFKPVYLDEIEMSVRTTNALHQHNIRTMRDLWDLPPWKLEELRGLGKKSQNEIIYTMQQHGIDMNEWFRHHGRISPPKYRSLNR